MVSKMSITDVLGLTVAERILLVQDIWDSIANLPEAVELTKAQRQELDARLEAYHRDSTAGSAWDVVKSRISQGK